MEAGKPVYVIPKPTLADGLAVPKVGPAAFATAKNNVDRTILVRYRTIVDCARDWSVVACPV